MLTCFYSNMTKLRFLPKIKIRFSPDPLWSSKNGSVILVDNKYTLKHFGISKLNKSCGVFGAA